MKTTRKAAPTHDLRRKDLKTRLSSIAIAFLLVFVYSQNIIVLASGKLASAPASTADRNKLNGARSGSSGSSSGARSKSAAPDNCINKASTNTASSRPKPKPGSKMYLWKMTAENGATLYLLGTIHVFKKEFYPLPEEMEKALAKSKSLLVEVDASKPESKEKLQIAFREKGSYIRGKIDLNNINSIDNLSKHISKQTLNELQAYCEKSKIPMVNMIMFKPATVTLLLEQLEVQRMGYTPEFGLDLHLMAEANAAHKKIIGLETEDFQMGLFGDLSDEMQELMLKVTLEDMPTMKEDIEQIMTCWLDGNEESMAELISKDVKEHPEYAPIEERILYQRNVTMAEKLEAYLKGPPTDVFTVAVGSAHLIGPRSIIALLKAKGYKCKQVVAGDPI